MPKHAADTPADDSSEKKAPKHGVRRADAADERDERIGLTEAFSPVGDASDAPFGDERDRIGLTEAFAPVSEGAHAGGFSYKGDADDEYPDALESLEPQDAPPLLFGDGAAPVEDDQAARALHGKPSDEVVPPHQRKSRRTRRALIVVIVLLLALIAALVYFGFRWVGESQMLATQQTQEHASTKDVAAIQKEEAADDAAAETEKKTSAPDLVALLGLAADDAVAALERGATVTSEREVNEEGNDVKKNVTVALTDEPADSRSGTPTVYLGLDEGGIIIEAGYSAATASLGYGSLSFADAVKNEHIVEKTLQEAGIDVPEGTVELPTDKAEYSTYASDGTTLTKEDCSFSGTVGIDGVEREWSSVLTYDYTTANMSGNLADTIRLIYVYVNV